MSLVVDGKMEEASDLDDLASMKENLPPSTHTVIFLDWDDTLLCSSVLSHQGIKLDSELENVELIAQLEELSDSVIGVLNVAMSHGTVYIVTNGETGWVQLSAQKFLPNVVPFLNKLRVLSARSTFEPLYPDSPMKWKYHAFQESLAREYPKTNSCIRNVLSFGDSHAEREAIRAVTRGHPNTRTKSIKFAERPTIEQLQRQLELVSDCFPYITSHEADLDLCMSLSVSPNPEPEDPEEPEPVVTYV